MNLTYGEIEQQDLSKDLHQYRVRMSTSELSPWMPALTPVAGSARQNHALSIGTQVACLSSLYEGLILGALNSTQKPATTNDDKIDRSIHADGAQIEYNAKTHQLNAALPAGATTHLTSRGGITFDGDLTVNGDVTVNGDETVNGSTSITGNLQVGQAISAGNGITSVGNISSNGDIVANGISLKQHTHGGVQVGSGSTGPAQ